MTNQELAEQIRQKYIPFAFTCGCAGNHPECALVFDSTSAWVQHDTVLRIAKFIETLKD
jgi:hypothetical protein